MLGLHLSQHYCTGQYTVRGPVHTDAFSNENAYFSMRFRLSSTLRRWSFSSKTHTFQNAVQSGDISKRSVSKTEPNENASVWTQAFENADVIHLSVACADDYCSVFERCVFKRRKRISVMEGENAAKTIVWSDTFLVKTAPEPEPKMSQTKTH